MMIRIMLLLAAVLCLTSPTFADSKDGWQNLLSGNSLDKHWKTTGNWSLGEDGVVSLVPREGESGWTRYSAYLWQHHSFTNFEIQFEYQVEKGGNSGFYFHVADEKDPVTQGIEVQIYDSYGHEKLTDHTSGGVIPRIPPTANNAKAPGEWNKFHITCKDDQLTVVLNDKEVNKVDLSQGPLAGRPKTGSIGFQDHGLPFKLRNIMIRPIQD